MAFVQITICPGLTAEQYDKVMELGAGNKLGDGELFHVAGPEGDTWFVIDGWASREQCDANMAKLMPAFAETGVDPSGFSGHEFEIHNHWRGK